VGGKAVPPKKSPPFGGGGKPRGGGGVLWEFLGGDVLLGPWNP